MGILYPLFCVHSVYTSSLGKEEKKKATVNCMSESDQYLNKTKYKEEMENKKREREKYYTDKYSFHKIEGYYSLQDVDCLIST